MTKDEIRERLIWLMCEAKKADTEDVPFSDFLADFLVASGVTVQEWIPASEPPKAWGEYNVMIAGGEIATTLFYSESRKGWYEFNNDEYEMNLSYNVTHWMPLPTPPKEAL